MTPSLSAVFTGRTGSPTGRSSTSSSTNAAPATRKRRGVAQRSSGSDPADSANSITGSA